MGAGGCKPVDMFVLASGVGVEMPESEFRGRVEACVSGVGSMNFVRFGKGEEGREGGSWWEGVAVGSAIFVLERVVRFAARR